MPLPKPFSKETRKKFIDRCMRNPTMNEEFSDPSQRRAVCERQWNRKANEDAHKLLSKLIEVDNKLRGVIRENPNPQPERRY